MRKFTMKDFKDAIEVFMRFRDDEPDAYSVTLFCAPLENVGQRIRVTKKGKDSCILTFGRPNYREREFLKLCKKAKAKPRRVWFNYKKKKVK